MRRLLAFLATGASLLLGAPASAVAEQPSCNYFVHPASQSRISYDPFMVFFDWNSDTLTPVTAQILDAVADVYGPLAHCTLTISAHTDLSGPAAYNRALSLRRARAVAAYLRRRGVTSRFRIEAHGETMPLVDTADGVRELQNRRAEIVIWPADR